jgi:DNA invertase Pin-like site-specific DNA recombinase
VKAVERKTILRCAIYTRVSTETGLEQEFNSLDNQREASEAYVKSQAHEGWKLIRDRYDDGGFSGGSMDRPALKKLLDDVRARRIDIVIVYKVDRLTRSLADFAKLVELFDAHDVSFISVTQSFNTTTSMGRLTLNMLLSFAQFEREITGERIRDKVAASKRRGIWMGGAVPLGYRVEDRALHVVEEQADFVRDLFRRYLEVGSVVRLKAMLDAENVRSPVRIVGSGRQIGGGSMSRGQMYHILSNPIYTGRLRHKGQVHDGLHSAVVEPEIWDQTQAKLVEQTRSRSQVLGEDKHSFLAGKLFDDRGNRMSPCHAARGSRRWRYYVSQAQLKGRKSDLGSVARVPAAEIERQVMDAVKANLAERASSMDGRGVRSGVGQPTTTNESLHARRTRSSQIPCPVNDKDARDAIERVTISQTQIQIALADAAIRAEGQDRNLTQPWTSPSPHRRREIIQGAGASSSTNRPMRVRARGIVLSALRNSHRWLDELSRDPDKSIETLAVSEGKSARSIRMTLSLAFVSPTIVAAAIEGRLPRGFGVKRLMDLPLLWSAQWTALGLRAPSTP